MASAASAGDLFQRMAMPKRVARLAVASAVYRDLISNAPRTCLFCVRPLMGGTV